LFSIFHDGLPFPVNYFYQTAVAKFHVSPPSLQPQLRLPVELVLFQFFSSGCRGASTPFDFSAILWLPLLKAHAPLLPGLLPVSDDG